MSVQAKIVLLLVAIVATLIGGLVLLKVWEDRRFQEIAESRAAERERNFDVFLKERGDNLQVLVQDSTTWDDMVRAVVKSDRTWTDKNISDETLATYKVNAVWIYKTDQTLFFSRNNRYNESLRELPLPPEAFAALFAGQRTCHFFIHVPLGWMEVRGGTIHPSLDAQKETTPQGYLFAGQFWIDENIRQMSLFTGYDIRIEPAEVSGPSLSSKEEEGLITFSRIVPGWDGKPVARIVVQNDSPLVRELNRAAQRQFIYLLLFSLLLFLVLAASLNLWIRRPLRRLARGLETGQPATLVPLQKMHNEFGQLAELILKFRRTEEALHQAEDQLRHAQKLEAVGRLAGGVAHDFNNILTAIIGYSELLEARLAPGSENGEFAQLIRQAGEKAAGLTAQLLAFSRRQLLMPRVLDLNALVAEMKRLMQRVIGEHIRIQFDLRAEDARVCADPSQLEQVILNLGVNARDAMPRGGTLTISTENRRELDPSIEAVDAAAPADYIFLVVTDTGSGMDAETKERIFEPFFTTKGPGRGTGLGLATVYGVVKQSGGGIAVESNLGQGSKFLVYFPRAAEPIAQPQPLAPAPVSAGAETVLVVEDEEVVRQLVCAVLGDVGYDVLSAALPSEALSLVKARDGSIELLVTDVVMPEMHGPALARQLLDLRPGLKVLFVSGYSENDISDQGVVEPGLEVLQKPFTKQSLIRKVREMLDGHG
jgi:signal transduction histidine kinase/CheY-like chemotaxis protein